MAKQKGRAAVEKKNEVLKKLKVEYVSVTDIKPNVYNPNRQSEHDFELLLKSMGEDGFTQPIVCQKDLTIVDGEHRWRAAQELGMKEVPVVRVNMTPEQMRIATLRHNRARGSEDVELTAQVLKDLQELGAIEWAQDSLMMDDVELNQMLDDIAAPEILASDEWTDAWEPSGKTGNFSGDDISTTATLTEESDSTAVTAGTSAAIEALREREKKIKEAKTEEEREMAKSTGEFYRVNLLFSNEEADIVRSVLGTEPAQKLLALCKKEIDG